jgi:Trypsin-like peptidase domain
MSSVVELFDKKLNVPIGSAYFINDDPRLLITAQHVVKSASHPLHLSGQNSGLNQGTQFAVELFDPATEMDLDNSTTSDDVVLLKVTDLSFRGTINPIDFTFWIPPLSNTIYVIGYPTDEPGESFAPGTLNRILHRGDIIGVTDQEPTPLTLYEVRHSKISQGYSGGPLLTESGLVIGTVHEEKNDMMGYYEPLVNDERIMRLLGELSLSPSLKNINDMLLNGTPESNIASALNEGGIRNISLTVWYFNILRSKQFNPPSEAVRSLLECPMLKVLRDRNLGKWADGLEEAVLYPTPKVYDVYEGR